MNRENLWQKYKQSKDESARQELIISYLDLVKYIAGRIAVTLPSGISREDLESSGIIGLLEAVERFDPSQGVDFEAFAGMRIRGAMYDEIRKANWVPRTTWQKINRIYNIKENLEKQLGRSATTKELAAEAGISEDELKQLNGQLAKVSFLSLDATPFEEEDENLSFVDILPDYESPDPLKEVCDNDDKESLSRAIEKLQEKDQLILSLYYHEGLTLKEIGQVLDVTESRVCQLHSRAIAKLRKKLTEREG